METPPPLPACLRQYFYPFLPTRKEVVQRDYELVQKVLDAGQLNVVIWLVKTYEIDIDAFRIRNRDSMKKLVKQGHIHIINWLRQYYTLNDKDKRALDIPLDMMETTTPSIMIYENQHTDAPESFSELPLSLQDDLNPLPALLSLHDYQLLREVMTTGNLPVLQWLHQKYELTIDAFRSGARSGMRAISSNNYVHVREWMYNTFDLNAKDRAALNYVPPVKHDMDDMDENISILPSLNDEPASFSKLPQSIRTKLRSIGNDLKFIPIQLFRHDYQLLREIMATGNLPVLQWLHQKYELTIDAFRSNARSGMWAVSQYNHVDIKEWLDATFKLNGKDRHALMYKIDQSSCTQDTCRQPPQPSRTYPFKQSKFDEPEYDRIRWDVTPSKSSQRLDLESEYNQMVGDDEIENRLLLDTALEARCFDYLVEQTKDWTVVEKTLKDITLVDHDIDAIFSIALQEGHLECLDWVIMIQDISRKELLQTPSFFSSIQIAINHDRSEVLQWLQDAFDLDYLDYSRFNFCGSTSSSTLTGCQHWLLSHFKELTPIN